MPIDREVYFDSVREELFEGSMTQDQVDGQNTLLEYWERDWEQSDNLSDLRWLAYILATTKKETPTFQPIAEYGKGEGKPYGVEDPETKQTYYGRGYVQLTWRDNYKRATEQLGLAGNNDLEWHADQALDPVIAAAIIFEGMREGWFTSKKLADYFNDIDDDPYNAREIVNGHDCAHEIEGFHHSFLHALDEAHRELPGPSRDKVRVAVEVPDGIEVEVTVNGELL